jgi:hypothetical protein
MIKAANKNSVSSTAMFRLLLLINNNTNYYNYSLIINFLTHNIQQVLKQYFREIQVWGAKMKVNVSYFVILFRPY